MGAQRPSERHAQLRADIELRNSMIARKEAAQFEGNAAAAVENKRDPCDRLDGGKRLKINSGRFFLGEVHVPDGYCKRIKPAFSFEAGALVGRGHP